MFPPQQSEEQWQREVGLSKPEMREMAGLWRSHLDKCDTCQQQQQGPAVKRKLK